MKNPSYSPTPKIHFTKSGSEFFLSWNERQNPKTGETKEVHFAVIHRICGLGEIDAAIQLLYEAACAADLPWEVFVAALSYAESRPARRVPGSPRIARLGNKNELYKAMRQEVVEEWVQLPPGVNIGRYIRNQIEAIVRSAGPWDKQFVFAQFRGEAIMKPIEIVAGFAEEAEDLTNRFGPIEDGRTSSRLPSTGSGPCGTS